MLVWLYLHAWGLVSSGVGFGGAEPALGKEWAASFSLKEKVVAAARRPNHEASLWL